MQVKIKNVKPEGQYILSPLKQLQIVNAAQRRITKTSHLDGFEVEYVPDGKTKYDVSKIRLVQAVTTPQKVTQIDAYSSLLDVDNKYKENARTPGGIPLPAYTDTGLVGTQGHLSYRDAPFDPGTLKFFSSGIPNVLFKFETCALCKCNNNEEHNLGCVTFSFNNKTRLLTDISVTPKESKYTVDAKTPGNLWNTAVKNWNEQAGRSIKE
jgi:hypothetical protein